MEREVRDSCGKARLGETPQAQAEEAPRPPLDKRVTERKSTCNFSETTPKGVLGVGSGDERYVFLSLSSPK
ncbi:hypothetical protein KEH51_14210 [[Brevibacterium] frigoritolerans]|uniref:Uncharacterized protein n=1 Tax=Peribacillus frigoritolerans TaxID=450367 RepID=A0A941J2S2_9BACI|nr:hypothetical protein [Peribacillus frigoritolerans]